MVDSDRGAILIKADADPTALEKFVAELGPLAALHDVEIEIVAAPEAVEEPHTPSYNPDLVSWTTDIRASREVAAISQVAFQDFAEASGYTKGQATRALNAVSHLKNPGHRYVVRDEAGLSKLFVADRLAELIDKMTNHGLRVPGISAQGAKLLRLLSENVYITDETTE